MERPSWYDAKDPRLGMCWEAVMIGITVYVHVSTERSCDRSPDMHVIWLEERVKGPILQRIEFRSESVNSSCMSASNSWPTSRPSK